jgi:hypothetical protein
VHFLRDAYLRAGEVWGDTRQLSAILAENQTASENAVPIHLPRGPLNRSAVPQAADPEPLCETSFPGGPMTRTGMTSRRGRAFPDAFQQALFAALNFFVLFLLAVFAVMREQPLFWRNAGGWPIWLRDLVAVSFYPLLGLELLLLLLFSSACLRDRRTTQSSAIFTLPLLWGLLFLVLAVLAANNLDNLLSGRPLHWHGH